MKLIITADTHGIFPENLPDGDVFIHCGDFTNFGLSKKHPHEHRTHYAAERWMAARAKQYKHVLYVCGNHDLDTSNQIFEAQADNIKCLDHDYFGSQIVTIEGVTFTGVSLTPCINMPFIASMWTHSTPSQAVDYIRWESVPKVDVVVSHGPVFGHLDLGHNGDHFGSKGALKYVETYQPKLFVHGHNHRQGKSHLGKTDILNVAQNVWTSYISSDS